MAAVAAIGLTLGACQKNEGGQTEDGPSEEGEAAVVKTGEDNPNIRTERRTGPRRKVEQIEPPMALDPVPSDVIQGADGLVFKILSEGSGEGSRPGRNDTAFVHYTAWKMSGETTFNSRRRNSPQRRFLPQQPPGWVASITDMKVGEKRLVWMPPELARMGRAKKPDETMVYEIELVKFDSAPAVPDDVAAVPEGAKRTKSGLAYQVLQRGDGKDKPDGWDIVSVHYTSWKTDGTMLQSTHTRKRAQPVDMMRTHKGWSDAIQLMVVGDKIRAWVPPELLRVQPGVPKDQMVVYEFELESITDRPEPPPVPKDVAAPPKNAKKTDKGVFYKVLTKGSGSESPKTSDGVVVHYTGWTTDGKIFDSSLVRGEPAQFALNRVIPGWTDGVISMVKGERRRLWIPQELAYQGRPGAPAGMLVFDIELIDFRAIPARPAHGGHMGHGHGHGGGNRGRAAVQGDPHEGEDEAEHAEHEDEK